MGFVLFLLVNAALFLRPAELLPSLRGFSIYEYLMLACLAVSALRIWQTLAQTELQQQPITLFVFGLWAAAVLSHLGHGNLDKANLQAIEFLKVVLYYLLLISVVNTPQRLRLFLGWLALCAMVITCLAVLNFHHVIELNTLKALQESREEDALSQIVVRRLVGTGIFNDPNDFCLLLTIAVPIAAYFLIDGSRGGARLFWLAPLGLFFYALVLTKSRGGLLGVLFGVLVLLKMRFGTRVALVLLLALLPLAVVVFAMRGEVDLNSREDTAQERIQLWSEAFTSLKGSPLFGIGARELSGGIKTVVTPTDTPPEERQEPTVMESHNSYLHAYAEMGLLGGTLFFGVFFFALWALYRLPTLPATALEPPLRQLNPYVLGLVAGFAALLMTLSRNYIVPTYLVLGIAAVQIQLAQSRVPGTAPALRLNAQFFQRLAAVSVVFLIAMYLGVRVLVRF